MKLMKTPAVVECTARTCKEKKANVDAACTGCPYCIFSLVDLSGNVFFQIAAGAGKHIDIPTLDEHEKLILITED